MPITYTWLTIDKLLVAEACLTVKLLGAIAKMSRYVQSYY